MIAGASHSMRLGLFLIRRKRSIFMPYPLIGDQTVAAEGNPAQGCRILSGVYRDADGAAAPAGTQAWSFGAIGDRAGRGRVIFCLYGAPSDGHCLDPDGQV
ncbi:hypothetical protein [Acidisphaera sp. S103]|uniref:hypothetical protein n=1 Tax=Acidisphaera sp. S103 TaxID=1747223 RepID=UPI00131EAC41|nr:hypothetical protein [Acidisphaera sp. S103]